MTPFLLDLQIHENIETKLSSKQYELNTKESPPLHRLPLIETHILSLALGENFWNTAMAVVRAGKYKYTL